MTQWSISGHSPKPSWAPPPLSAMGCASESHNKLVAPDSDFLNSLSRTLTSIDNKRFFVISENVCIAIHGWGIYMVIGPLYNNICTRIIDLCSLGLCATLLLRSSTPPPFAIHRLEP